MSRAEISPEKMGRYRVITALFLIAILIMGAVLVVPSWREQVVGWIVGYVWTLIRVFASVNRWVYWLGLLLLIFAVSRMVMTQLMAGFKPKQEKIVVTPLARKSIRESAEKLTFINSDDHFSRELAKQLAELVTFSYPDHIDFQREIEQESELSLKAKATLLAAVSAQSNRIKLPHKHRFSKTENDPVFAEILQFVEKRISAP